MNRKLFVSYQKFISFTRKLVYVVLPGCRCIVCGAEAGDLPVCKKCAETYFAVKSVKSGLCAHCGKQLISEHNLCMSCRENSVLIHVDSVYPLFSYRLWASLALCRWKLDGERVFSMFFAGLLQKRLKELYALKGDFVIVPVPPRPGKIRRTGWDQIDELSKILENFYEFPFCRILERYSVVEQKSLDKTERMESIGKSYGVKRNVFAVPERICLLDDVLTTGATLESCAVKLKEAGAKEVFAVTLFTVDR